MYCHTVITSSSGALLLSVIELYFYIVARDGETRTDLGMQQAMNELSNHHDGARRGNNRIMIILTDGRSTEPDMTSRIATSVHR